VSRSQLNLSVGYDGALCPNSARCMEWHDAYIAPDVHEGIALLKVCDIGLNNMGLPCLFACNSGPKFGFPGIDRDIQSFGNLHGAPIIPATHDINEMCSTIRSRVIISASDTTAKRTNPTAGERLSISINLSDKSGGPFIVRRKK